MYLIFAAHRMQKRNAKKVQSEKKYYEEKTYIAGE